MIFVIQSDFWNNHVFIGIDLLEIWPFGREGISKKGNFRQDFFVFTVSKLNR